MPRIDYYFSILSPFCYLAGMRLEEIAARHGAGILYRPVDAGRIFAETGGVPVPKRHPFRREYRMQELRRLPKLAGLPLNPEPAHWPTDAAPASMALIAARQAGLDGVGAAAHALMRACWAEERDVADPAVIRDCFAAAGIDFDALEIGDAARAEWDANVEAALAAGVFGAPFYVVGDERFWGQDRLAHLDAHLEEI